MPKKNIPILIFSLLLVFVFAVATFTPSTAEAQDYTLLAPLPGTNMGEAIPVTPTSFGDYLQKLFDLSLGIIIALAVIMIVIGGAQYLSTDAVFGKEQGKEKLWNALQGLVIALGTVIILNTINPGLLKINLDLGKLRQPEKVVVKDATTPPYNILTPRTYYATDQNKLNAILGNEQKVRSLIASTNVNIDINNGGLGRGWCTSLEQTSGCTNVGLLSTYAIRGLDGIQRDCTSALGNTCSIVITGGTEWWIHKENTSHQPGNTTVDLRKTVQLEDYIKKKTGLSELEMGKTYIIQMPSGGKASFFNEDPKHFHVTIL